MQRAPSAYCSICTNPVKTDLIGFLFSLSVHHPKVPVYLFVDKETNSVVQNLKPYLRLTLHIKVNMDEFKSPRWELEKNGGWQRLMLQKMDAMDLALSTHEDVCYLDTDVLLLEPILVDKTKEIGVSPHRILENNHKKFGLYNGGILWTRNKNVPQRWRTLARTNSRYFEQACIEGLVDEFSHFLFGEEYNLSWWKVEESPEPPNKMYEYFESGSGEHEGKPLFKGKPIVFVHTHFSSDDKILFNTFIFGLLIKCKRYRECMIIIRMRKNNWILTLPKQPIQGAFQHNDDSFRELVRIWDKTVTDLDVRYSTEQNHCFLEPKVCLYDRPQTNSQWLTDDVQESFFVLLGNPSIEESRGLIRPPHSEWIFWARHPMILEDFIQKSPLKSYDGRTCESVFVGNVENTVQAKHRLQSGDWGASVERYEMITGNEHKYSQREYLQILANSRFGLSLRGFGCKCNRDIELLALGTVPIFASGCDTQSYIEPLVEGTHYLRASSPEEVPRLVRAVDKARWTRMSEACKAWYTRNAHSSNSWKRTLRRVLYGE